MKITKERIIEMIPLTLLVIIGIIILLFSVIFSYGWIQSNDELIQVNGEVLEKNKGGLNYIFVVKEDNGHIVKFSVDFEEYYTYEVGSYYSGEIRRGSFMEGP